MSDLEGKQAADEEHPEMHQVLELALEAGRILLGNGAEIFRVEETIEHICKRFGVEEVDSFVLSNGIFLTAYSKGKESFAKVKHVPIAGIHLGIVTEVNDLSREIAAGRVGIDEAFRRLKEIEKLPPKKSLYLVLAAGLGSGAFCYLIKSKYLGEFDRVCDWKSFVCVRHFCTETYDVKDYHQYCGWRFYYSASADCIEY